MIKEGKRNWVSGLTLGLIAGGILEGTAAIVVFDILDSKSIDVSHLGDDRISLEVDDIGSPWITLLVVTRGDDAPLSGCANAQPFENCFSVGESHVPQAGLNHSIYASYSPNTQKLFHFGSSPGLNYAPFDLDGDSRYETVVEFDFGSDPGFSSDVITRYAYDDTGAGLDIPQAIAALNGIPEPSVLLSIALGGFVSLRRRR